MSALAPRLRLRYTALSDVALPDVADNAVNGTKSA